MYCKEIKKIKEVRKAQEKMEEVKVMEYIREKAVSDLQFEITLKS